MAITTYSELLTALTNWRGGNSTLTANYPEWIALFEAWFNRNHRVRQMESDEGLTIDSTSVPGLSKATLPTDYLAWRSVEWFGITPARELQYVHPKRLAVGWPAIGDGQTTEFFTITGDLIEFTPVDDAENAVHLRYYAKVPPLTSDSIANWLIEAHPDFYLNGCLYEASKLQRDTEAMVLYKGARDEMSRELKELSAHSQGEDAVRTSDYF